MAQHPMISLVIIQNDEGLWSGQAVMPNGAIINLQSGETPATPVHSLETYLINQKYGDKDE